MGTWTLLQCTYGDSRCRLNDSILWRLSQWFQRTPQVIHFHLREWLGWWVDLLNSLWSQDCTKFDDREHWWLYWYPPSIFPSIMTAILTVFGGDHVWSWSLTTQCHLSWAQDYTWDKSQEQQPYWDATTATYWTISGTIDSSRADIPRDLR